MTNKIAAIILCAGKSTRMKSNLSKMLHKLCGQELCLWPINLALKYSNNTIITLGYQNRQIQNTIKAEINNKATFSIQKKPIGTGDAVRCSLKKINKNTSSVIILYGDSPLIKEKSLDKLIQISKKKSPSISMFTTILKNPFGYGRIIRNQNNEIVDIIEENKFNLYKKEIFEINTGIYIFNYNFLIQNINKLFCNKKKDEYYLTDLISIASKQKGISKTNIASSYINSDEIFGVNNQLQLAEAQEILNFRIIKSWMKKGVNFINPKTVYIEAKVKLSPGIKIEPGVMIKGKTYIKSNVTIGVGSVLEDMIIQENVIILPYSICKNSYIGKNSTIGPFAQLRPKVKIKENTKIGNFVEIKNSTIQKGVKINHLSYIGDSEIGQKSNIGAGTITCNYDGFKKYKIILKNNVFIGSNSTLIAPLKIGAGAYVGAGSTLNKNVGSYDLALARTKQINKKEYAKKLKEKLKKTKKIKKIKKQI